MNKPTHTEETCGRRKIVNLIDNLGVIALRLFVVCAVLIAAYDLLRGFAKLAHLLK